MTFREFVLPEYHEFVDSLGVGPEPVEGEDAVSLRFELGEEVLVITLDLPGRSVHCRWSRDRNELVEIFREGATRVQLAARGEARTLDIVFQTDALKGELHFQVSPSIAIRDRILFA
jgi:hypothetical protein